MTEAEYISSTDPTAMRTVLVERGLRTEKRCRAFVEACRWKFDSHNSYGRPGVGWGPDAGENFDYWLSLPDCPDVPFSFRCSLIRCIFGNPWRRVAFRSHRAQCNQQDIPGFMWKHLDADGTYQTWTINDGGHEYTWGPWALPEGTIQFNPDWLTYRNGLVPKLARAAVTRECDCDGGYVSFPDARVDVFEEGWWVMAAIMCQCDNKHEWGEWLPHAFWCSMPFCRICNQPATAIRSPTDAESWAALQEKAKVVREAKAMEGQ